ncbi:MAG TPA: SDR family oxidoreductase [Mycobacteriales bacterium]|nr:SDR family oxidoreductase [Mycobacteriales bacterium]
MSLEDGDLRGLRVLVVGASSGIGRAIATQLVEGGAKVAAAARRVDRVQEISNALAICCDVRHPQDCDRAVADSVARLGGLDAVVYAAGIGPFTPLDVSGREAWLEVLETNLIGPALITRAALPHLTHDGKRGRALFLSSDAAERCYPGLVAYGASKAGLSRFCQGLQAEFPALRVSDVIVGPTGDTGVSDHMDPDLLGYWVERWYAEGWVRFAMQTSAEVAAVVIDTLRAREPATVIRAHGGPEVGARPL